MNAKDKLKEYQERLRLAEQWVCRAASDHCYWGELDTEAHLRDAVAEWRTATGLVRLAEYDKTQKTQTTSKTH